MSVVDLFRLVLRRWYVVALACALAALMTVHLDRDGGIFSSRTIVEFRWPGTSRLDPYNGFTSDGLIAFTEAVAQRINGGASPINYSQGFGSAPLYGAGLREADATVLTHVGNQWVSTNPMAQIEVDVVGRTEEYVRRRQDELVARVLETAAGLQDPVVARSGMWITSEVQPTTTSISFIGPTRLSRMAAFAAMGAAGLIGGVGVAAMLDRALAARQRREARVSGWSTVGP